MHTDQDNAPDRRDRVVTIRILPDCSAVASLLPLAAFCVRTSHGDRPSPFSNPRPDAWAHLIRGVKYLVTLPDPVTRRFGGKLLATIKILFRTWHRREQTPADRWQREADRAKQSVLKVARRPPWRSERQNIAERFRFVVIDRKITQGAHGPIRRR